MRLVRDGAVAHLWLDRPDAMNAIDHAMATALADTLESLTASSDIRCVTLRGTGRSFMAGGDLRLFRTTAEKRLALLDELIGAFHRAIRAIRRMPVPVIVGVHGAAAGAGFSLALACDFVICDESARFIPAYGKIGATPDGGLTWSLCQAVGRIRANEILMLGEPLTALAAERLGLINRVVTADTLHATVEALAAQIAAGSRAATGAMKKLVADAEADLFERHLDREHEAYRRAVINDDFAIGIEAFFAREAPRF